MQDRFVNIIMYFELRDKFCFLSSRYKDACFYDFGQQDSPRQTKSEFRQVIWKDSKNFGISYKVYGKEKKTCVRIVALYTPAMEEANINLHDQVKKGKFLGCQNGVFTYKGGITVSQCG
jgi:hypothetical protein